MLFVRALLSFLLLPGVVAFFVPALLVPRITTRTVHVVGGVPFILGVIVLLWCVRDFYVAGRGTLAPWDPPRHLVRVGLYRYSRNPMYVGMLVIAVGLGIAFASDWTLVMVPPVAFVMHFGVVVREERYLEAKFGEPYRQYKARAARWGIC